MAHRYKEFERLHKEVKRVFPKEEVPAFPKKTLFQSAMSLKVIEERRIGLEVSRVPAVPVLTRPRFDGWGPARCTCNPCLMLKPIGDWRPWCGSWMMMTTP